MFDRGDNASDRLRNIPSSGNMPDLKNPHAKSDSESQAMAPNQKANYDDMVGGLRRGEAHAAQGDAYDKLARDTLGGDDSQVMKDLRAREADRLRTEASKISPESSDLRTSDDAPQAAKPPKGTSNIPSTDLRGTTGGGKYNDHDDAENSIGYHVGGNGKHGKPRKHGWKSLCLIASLKGSC